MAAPFTFRHDEKIVGDRDAAAARTGRSRDQLVARAIADVVLQRSTSEAQALRQSLSIAVRARDPRSDEHAFLAELRPFSMLIGTHRNG